MVSFTLRALYHSKKEGLRQDRFLPPPSPAAATVCGQAWPVPATQWPSIRVERMGAGGGCCFGSGQGTENPQKKDSMLL